MKDISLLVDHVEIEKYGEGIRVNVNVDIEQVINLFTYNEIEEYIHDYERLFLLMKDYYRSVEKRDDEFFK